MQNGQIDLDKLGVPQDEQDAIVAYQVATAKKMSPSLNLPPLLEKARQEWQMIDAVFSRQAAFDRVYVYQIPEHKAETFMEGGAIIMPDASKSSRRYHAARGVVVSAGLSALDTLRSNGMDLGHTINFIANAPYRIEVDFVAGKAVEILPMNVGDLIGSEELATLLLSGVVKINCVDQKHVFVDEDGHQWDPKSPWTSDDQI